VVVPWLGEVSLHCNVRGMGRAARSAGWRLVSPCAQGGFTHEGRGFLCFEVLPFLRKWLGLRWVLFWV
jgi:hypothetical protein